MFDEPVFINAALAHAHIDDLTLPVNCALDNSCIQPDLLARKVPLDNNLTLDDGDLRSTAASEPLNSLSRLPLELLHAICAHADVASLAALRRTSRLLRGAVLSQRQYLDLSHYAPALLRALQASGGAPLLSLSAAHALVFVDIATERRVSPMRCAATPSCINAAPLVHLPSGTRICPPCLRSATSLQAVPVADLRARFLLDLKHDAPAVRPLPLSDCDVPVVHIATLNAARVARGEHAIPAGWTAGKSACGPQDVRALMRGTGASAGRADEAATRRALAVRVPVYSVCRGSAPQEQCVRACKACAAEMSRDRGREGQDVVLGTATFAEDDLPTHLARCVKGRAMLQRAVSRRGEISAADDPVVPQQNEQMAQVGVQWVLA